MNRKEYLGDGLYANFDGYHIVLTTENGRSVQNRVCLEPQVFSALLIYEKGLREKITEGANSD